MIKIELKDILKKERKKHGYTQQEIADILCIARGSYTKYETGDNTPPLENFIKLANLYNVSMDYLAGRYKEKEEN